MSYKVKLDIFEGPFDLLVYLIERAGVDIYDVNISEITDQYLGYADAMEQIDPDTAAEFMVLAATLLQIKSRMLLPGAQEESVQTPEEDPRFELAEKLREYKKFRALAAELKLCEEAGEKIFTKPAEDLSQYTGQTREVLDADMNRFIGAFRAFLEKRRRIEEVRRRYERVSRERATMEEKTDFICRRLRGCREADFSELLSDCGDLYDVVLTFASLLELLARGAIRVTQERLFGEISVCLREEAEQL